MKFNSAKKPSTSQIIPVENKALGKPSFFSRLLPFLILGLILAAVAYVIYLYNFMPRAIGRIYSTEYEMSSKRHAFIEDIKVGYGDSVKKGERLVLLDLNELTARKEQALAKLKVAGEQIAARRGELGLRQDELRLKLEDKLIFLYIEAETSRVALNQDTARLESSRARMEGAKIELERAATLAANNAVSKQHLDIARTKYNALVKEVEYYSKVVESDQKRRVTADGRIDKFFKENQINVPIKEMMRPVIAALAEAQAELNLVDALIRNSELNAPADGIVVSIFRHKGCAVDIAEPILTVLHSDKTKVEAYVREKWLKNAVPGNKVKLTPFSNFYRSIPGKIIHVTNGVSKMPAEFLPVYEKQQLTGVRIVIELEEEWDGPAGAKFDIMF